MSGKTEKRKIQIGFSYSCNMVSKAIRVIENTSFSHIFLSFHSESLNRTLIYHASGHNVHFTNINRFLEKSVIVDLFEIEVTPEQYKQIMQFCVDNAGVPYGAIQLVGMSLMRLFGKVMKSNPFADGSATQVCSELIGRLMFELGYGVDLDKLEILGPKYLFQVLKDSQRQEGK
jgi:hypothetical protein